MSRAARVTRCSAVVTTLAAGVLSALAWAAPAQAAGVGAEATRYGTQDFVWPGAAPLTTDDFVWPVAPGAALLTTDDFVWPVAPGQTAAAPLSPDDFVWPAVPAES